MIKVNTPQLIFHSAFIAAWGLYIHSDTRIHFGNLRIIFGDNVYHRVHHSIREEHFDKNFAAYFPILDLLFGTYYPPGQEKFIAVGLTDPSPPTLVKYVSMPFRRTSQPTIESSLTSVMASPQSTEEA